MSDFSDYLENELLDHLMGATTRDYTSPSIWVGLYTAIPSDAGGGTEVTGGSYARKSTVAADWDTAASGVVDNVNAVTFVTATASWGTVQWFGLFDASVNGNLLVWSALTASKAVGDGDTAEFAAGSLTVTLD